MNHYQSMGYIPNASASQAVHGQMAQAQIAGNCGGMQMQMGMNGGGILTHQQQQPPMSHGVPHHLQQQPHQPASNGYAAPEEDFGYWAPPAPRLTAAAVRAARMEALYPYQALYGYHQPVHAPVPTPYGAFNQQMHQSHQQQQPHQSQAHHHAQLEHQLMLHHQLSKLNVYPGGRSMPPQEALAQQHAAPQIWDQQQRQHFQSQPQSAYTQPQPPAQASYDWSYNQRSAGPYQIAPQLQHQPEQRLPPQPHQFSQAQGSWEGYGQAGIGPGGGPTQQEWINSQRGTAAPAPQAPIWQGGLQNGEAHHYQHPPPHQPYAPAAEADAAAPAPQDLQSANAAQSTRSSDAGPAPPSPDTLDRSAVPIANLGAEITWAACAALLEPSLLRSSIAADSPCASNKGFSATSSPSIQTPSSLWSSTPLSQEGEWGCSSMQSRGFSPSEARPGPKGQKKDSSGNSSSPDSSASSSEPGTPPSERDGVEAGSRADAHGLGLAGVAMRAEDDFPPFKHSGQTESQSRFFGEDRANSPQQNVSRFHSSHRAATNAATVEKMRAGVSSVLKLISPDWRWSRNDHSLMSLRDHSPLAARSVQYPSPSSSKRISRSGSPASSRRSSINWNGSMSGSGVLGMVGSPRPDPNHHPSPSPSAETSPAFKRFVHQVLAQTLLSPTAFLLALLFVVRVPTLVTNSDGTVDQEALQLFAQPPSAAPFKLLTLGVMISNKHLDDNTFLNKTWNEVTGIPLDELNRMERYFLKRCGFEITVPDEVWSAFINRVRKREEAKAAAIQKVKRANIDSHVRAITNSALLDGRRTSSEINASEQCSRRLVSAIDEMIVNLGHLPPLDLSEPCVPVISPISSGKGENLKGSSYQIQDHRRPPLSHHHCHSAPPSALGTDDV